MDELILTEAAGVEAGAAACDVGVMKDAFEHAVEVVVPVGELLSGHRAGDGVSEQEDANVGLTRHDRAPVDVLDHRLAAGEISVEEYERLRNAMRPPAPPTRTHP